MQGWVKLHRELMEKVIWTESTPEQKTILITLLMMANHKGKEWEWQGHKFRAEPGQFVTSLEKIAEKCGKGITIANVRTAIKRFEKLEFLTNQSTNKNRLITIVNWGIYQASEDEPNKQPNKHLTSNEQATNKHLTTNKNVKNEKNVRSNEYSNDFEQFWSIYPRKKDKKKAFKSFKATIKRYDLNTIVQGTKGYARSIERDGTEERFIKHASTFLNNDSFNDYLHEMKQAPVVEEDDEVDAKLRKIWEAERDATEENFKLPYTR